MALLGFVAGYVVLMPLGCTASEQSVVESRGHVTTVSTSGTTCSSLIGIDHTGGRGYNPPLWPALLTGLVGAFIAGAIPLIAQRNTAPRPLSARTLGMLGVTLNATWASALAALGLFSDGSLDPQWRTALIFVALVASPAAVALAGLKRPALLLAAGILCFPLGFISLAGAALPLFIPGALYLIAYARS